MSKRRYALIASHPTAPVAWAFRTPSGGSGTYYFGGFYHSHGTAFTPAGGTNVGTANSSYAAHAYVVLGASSTDMVIRVTGTSITDMGVRTTSDTEDIDTSGGSANGYYETSKKFIGLVVYSLQSGTGAIINAGFAKYYDSNNSAFAVVGFEVTWFGGANDTGANIELLHHSSADWTYDAGGDAAKAAPAEFNMQTVHNTEYQVKNNQPGAFKKANVLDHEINGHLGEGTIWRITTTSNGTFEQGNILMYCTLQ